MERKTPLYDRHVALGGKIVPFAGYLLPVQYPAGVIAEHMAVRTAAGLFDVSHMGELVFTGPDALQNLNHMLTNDFTNMTDGQVRYSPMCNDAGGCVDDLIVYKVREGAYLVVVNAANKDKDAAWMADHLAGDCKMEDISETVAQVALQGPRSKEILLKLVGEGYLPKKYYSFIPKITIGGIQCLISRTGYTGEFGYELYCAAGEGPALWDLLLETGKDLGLIPCGLGARDTLRLEAAMPLYGHEMDDDVSPKEAGLPCKLDGKDFLGREAIIARGAPAVKRVGLKVTGRGIVREHCDLYYPGGDKVGRTTSGTHCPFLGYGAAMGYVDLTAAEPGTALEADVRGRRIPVEVVPLPFYKITR